MHEYDQIAEWYAAIRRPEVGIPDLAAFAQSLPPGAKVLDIGCGTGIPISRFLTQEGFEVVGLDSSPGMIAKYRANFPAVPIRCEPVQEASFTQDSFDAVVAWGVLFHLSEADQEAVIGKVAQWLKPDGRFLFTAGDSKGSVESKMNGVMFRYTSLGSGEYRRILESVGMRLEDEHSDAWDNYVYIAQKVDGSAR
jgi:cyclopropane fatty-acyl-phospholipid synthase-like methyltransferase